MRLFLWLPMYCTYLKFKVWVIWASNAWGFPKMVRFFVVNLVISQPFVNILEFMFC